MNTKVYRHLLVPKLDGVNLEWIRVQTGCRSLTATMSLMIRIFCTPEGLAFLKNHPMCPTHHQPRTVAQMMRERVVAGLPAVPTTTLTGAKSRTLREEKVAYDSEKVGAAVAARTLKDEV